ncbi:TPR-like protein, partial [Dioscorea alata]
MYSKCGFVQDARRVFDEMPERDVISWNTIIDGYFLSEMFPDVLQFFRCMLRSGVALDDSFVANGLVEAYGKCNFLRESLEVFLDVEHKDIVLINTLIGLFAKAGNFEEAFLMFLDNVLMSSMRPERATFVNLLSVIDRYEFLREGMQVHGLIVKFGFEADGAVENSLVMMYSSCDHVDEAFALLIQSGSKNPRSWTSMIKGYANLGWHQEAINTFLWIYWEGKMIDHVLLACVLSVAADYECLQIGNQLHATVIGGNWIQLSWTIMISGYVHNGSSAEALQFFYNMNREAISADSTALFSLYSNCGSLYETAGLFRTGMRHDLVSCTALLSSYAKHGYSEEALLCLVRMLEDGFKPNQFTLASALTAASKATSTQTGKVLHALVIKTGLDTNTSVGSALIDMYSKCGDIGSAISYFKGSSKCDIFLWNALLTGHAQHGNVTELLSIFEEMLNHELKPDSITFLAILNGCSHGGFVDKVLHYYNMMQDKYGIRPEVEHCTCVVDAFVRANLFKEAVNFIQGTGCKVGPEILRVFISSCTTAGLVQLGLAAAARMAVSGLTNNSAHVLLSNLYALDEKWIDARRIREAAQTDHSYIKEAGKSWIS